MTRILNRNAQFENFGPSILSRQMRGLLKRHSIPSARLDARKLLRDECPYHPGVYGWIDRDGTLIYVGKSKSLRKRLLSYFAKTPADHKMLRIRQHSEQLVWEPNSSELLALIREQELIYRWRPDFNKQGQPTRTQPAFLCLSGGTAPTAFLARRLSSRAQYCFGPISGTNRLGRAVIALNQVFRLRDCPDKVRFEFNNQKTLFEDPGTAQCIRYELGSCPGPCAGLCSKSEYQKNVNLCLDFLHGCDRTVLPTLVDKMKWAASKEAYERAAALRDYHDDLTWLDRRLTALRNAKHWLNGVIPIAAPRKRTAWMVMRGGRLVHSLTCPDRPERASRAHQTIARIATQSPQLPNNVLEMNLQLIVMSWLRKNPEMRSRLVSFEEAIRFCHKVSRRSAGKPA